jgi:hypothetical protein
LIGECKAYARFAHHTLLEDCRRKYCPNGETPLLITATPGQRDPNVTLPLSCLANLLNRIRKIEK